MMTQENADGLNLELSLRPPSPSPPPPPPPSSHNLSPTAIQPSNSQPNPKRRRRRADSTPIEPPYPWSTQQLAGIHELEYLRTRQITTITGDVKCNKCERQYEMGYDLVQKFEEISRFIEIHKSRMHDRAPDCWNNPVLPDCIMCMQRNCVEPVIDPGNNCSQINWLFLLLGQLLGCLKLEHLRYFCNHTKNHQTGAKNRLLYLTYLSLCKQLQPSNSLFFHRQD